MSEKLVEQARARWERARKALEKKRQALARAGSAVIRAETQVSVANMKLKRAVESESRAKLSYEMAAGAERECAALLPSDVCVAFPLQTTSDLCGRCGNPINHKEPHLHCDACA